jgi:hypothetical protein
LGEEAGLTPACVPPGLSDAMKGIVDSSTVDISGTLPFLVKQGAFRHGCFGVTPN